MTSIDIIPFATVSSIENSLLVNVIQLNGIWIFSGIYIISPLSIGLVFLDTFDTGINIIDSLEDKIVRHGRVIGENSRKISS